MFLASLRISYSTFHGWVKTWLLWLILKLVLAWSRCTSFSTYSNKRKWPKTSFKHTRCISKQSCLAPVWFECSPSHDDPHHPDPLPVAAPLLGSPHAPAASPGQGSVWQTQLSHLCRDRLVLCSWHPGVFRHCWQYEYCIMKIFPLSFPNNLYSMNSTLIFQGPCRIGEIFKPSGVGNIGECK